MSGHGDREFFSCRDEIIDSLNKGYPIVEVYRTLKGAKKITIGEKRFYAILSKYGVKKRELNQLLLLGEGDTMDKYYEKQLVKDKKSLRKNARQPCALLDWGAHGSTNNLPAIRGESLPASFEEEDEDFGIIRTPEDKLF